MKISLNEIKKLVPEAAKLPAAELVALIGSRLVEVEGVLDLAPKYEKATIVKVIECDSIEGTHLHLCQIDAGADPVQVVCGAPNVRKGMLAVWLEPGAVVPETYGEENFKLSVRKLRGFESFGMLAGLDELDLGDDHSGIVELDPSMDFPGETRNIRPGDSFAAAFDLNDKILDIENKSLTHRPDTFGLVGFAREVAGILGVKFTAPKTPETLEALKTAETETLKIDISDPEICPRYTCAVVSLKNPTAKSKYLTPDAVFLAKAGMRAIDKVVDLTNILMLRTGQPLHAFDYDKFLKVGGSKTPKIGVRLARPGETLQLLDEKTVTLADYDILITSNDVPVALAGAMGGLSTAIDAGTTRIILESATFSLYHLRKTQMAHGIFSEAITRFTKGQPAPEALAVRDAAVSALGGSVEALADAYPGKSPSPVVKITTKEINGLLGTTYSEAKIIKTLENVGFVVEPGLKVTAPSWRTDIHIKEDVIEEVGRLNGFDNIAKTLPVRPFVGAEKDPLLALKSRLRAFLSDHLAASEVLSYSFVSKKLQESVGEDPADSYALVNSLSPELECVRQTLIPSLLEKAALNLKSSYKDLALYEMNQVSQKSLGLTAENVPVLEAHLAFVVTGDFYRAKAYLFAMLKSLGLPAVAAPFDAGRPYFEPLRSAEIRLETAENSKAPAKTSDKIATLGEIRPAVLRRLKISAPVAAFELDLETLLTALAALESAEKSRKPLDFSKYPSVDRDLTLKVPADLPYAAVESALRAALASRENLLFAIKPASIFQNSPDTKNLSFSLTFSSLKKTLDAAEISAIMEEVLIAVRPLGAELV